MNSRFFTAILLFAATLSCEKLDPVSPNAELPFQITSLEINPFLIQFEPENGVRDTTIIFEITAGVKSLGNESIPVFLCRNGTFNYIFTRKSDQHVISQGTLDLVTLEPSPFANDQEHFFKQLQLQAKTFDFNDYKLQVFAQRELTPASNTASATLKLRGFAVDPPQIISVSNPDTLRIPDTGTQLFSISAKVVHPFDRSLINQVFLDILDESNTRLSGSPFEMFDDGNPNSGDLAAGDSIYTRQFQINASNNPAVYSLLFFARDNLGASSDTVKSKMVFIR